MMEFVVPIVLLSTCATLALMAYSLYRKEQVERKVWDLNESALYAAGEATAVARGWFSRSRLATVLHEAGMDGAPFAWLARTVGMSFFTACLMTVLSGQTVVGVVAGGAVALGFCARVAVLRVRRRTAFERQFARILPQIAGGVRSSLTLERAVRAAAAHVDDPLREELAGVLADVAYGTSLSEAFTEMARKTGSLDVRALAAAVRVQQRFGGAIAPVLDMIAAHAHARLKTDRELKTELAGTRLAKWFVAAAMPGIFMLMFVTNADFARFYAEEPLGWAVMGIAAVSEAFGLLACQRITAVRKVDA